LLLLLSLCAYYQRRIFGEVVGWLPPTNEDCALWRIRHNDGDEEDLEEEELLEAVRLAEEEEEKEKEAMELENE
jgi:hypothetical protein